MLIVIGALLLSTPLALQSGIKTNGEPYTFFDALFTAASAFSDTGLTITTTATQFTIFGKIIILFLIFTGGVGIIAIKIIILRLFGKAIGLNEIIMFKNERGSSKLGESTDVFIAAFKAILWSTLFGILALTPYFYFKAQPGLEIMHKNPFQSLWYALFHSVSALNNAGFDIIGPNSFAVFKDDLWVQFIIIILIIIGGIGFPVINDISRYINHKRKKVEKIFKWSLFTKITTITYFIIFIVGLILAIWFEISSNDQNSLWKLATSQSISAGNTRSKFEIINSIIFTTFSTRNAGFSIIPIIEFQESTKMLWSTMMWIGSSPASTAGGIRTTTFAIAMLAIFYTFYKQNGNRVFAFKHRVPSKTVFQALIIMFSSIGLLWIATVIIILDTHSTLPPLLKSDLYTFNNVFFEVSSAFGTTGLSSGITPLLGKISLSVIIVLMIIGQLGITVLFSFLSRNIKKNVIAENEVIYGEEDILIS